MLEIWALSSQSYLRQNNALGEPVVRGGSSFQKSPAGSDVPDEDRQRAAVYDLLAGYLGREATPEMLSAAGEIEAGSRETTFGAAVSAFANEARKADTVALRQAYFDLFIGVGRGLLVPYGSYYLTGFLNEKPLAKLRSDMDRLSIVRDPDVKEPEDHIASECEIMAGLLRDDFGVGTARRDHEARAFFSTHLWPWAGVFFDDLAASDVHPLYSRLGAIGSAFVAIETEAMDYAA